MSRQPWSIPTRSELWHVLIGVGVGFILALALIGVSGRMLAMNIFFIVIGVIPFAVFLINGLAWVQEGKERQRELEEEQKARKADLFWLRDANKAVTNKHIGLGWTGRHPRRR